MTCDLCLFVFDRRGGHVLFHLWNGLDDHPKNPFWSAWRDESTGRQRSQINLRICQCYIYISFRSLFFFMLQSPMFEKFGRIFDAKEKYPMNIHNSIPPVWNPWNPRCVFHPEIAVGILQIRMRDNQRRKSINVLGRGDVLRLEVRRKKTIRRLFKRGVWDGLWE